MLFVAMSILHDNQLAEDAVQEAFFRIAKNINKIGEINCHETKGYVVIIVKNVALTMRKKLLNLGFDEEDEENEELNGYDDVESSVFEKISVEKITNAILSLPETYRQAVYLSVVYEYKAGEIAKVLDISQEAVRKRLQRGREILKAKLIEMGITYNG